MTRPIDLDGFERKFAAGDDPWECRTSRFEAMKRWRSLRALSLVASTLDVGCGDGAATRILARRTLRTDACDGARAALASAGRLLGDDRRIRLHHALLPRELPRGRWRRIHVSELVYYLARHDIVALADALAGRLAPGGALIAVHHVTPFSDTTTRPSLAIALFHRRLQRRLRLKASVPCGQYVIAQFVACATAKRGRSIRSAPS